MRREPAPFQQVFLVCTNERDEGACCGRRGGTALRDALKAYVKAHGLQGRVRIVKSGCLDRCAQGPNIMVYPDQRWYAGVAPEDLPTIIAECLPKAAASQSGVSAAPTA